MGAVFGHPRRRTAPGGARSRSGEVTEATGTDIYDRTARPTREVLILAVGPRSPATPAARWSIPTGDVVGVAFAIAPDRPGVAYALAMTELERRPRPGDLTQPGRHRPLPRLSARTLAQVRPRVAMATTRVRAPTRSTVRADHRDAVGVGVDAEADRGDGAVVGDHEDDDHGGQAAEQRRGDELAEARATPRRGARATTWAPAPLRMKTGTLSAGDEPEVAPGARGTARRWAGRGRGGAGSTGGRRGSRRARRSSRGGRARG